ncbi:MAG: glutamine-hydrolyzing GMP synthase [Clostridiaceae bacterium]|jgi:GMP synthase (glutamine-hydrolysing)|nr:glutamine-hydrolyzing GMP synthase [Eubacteriales bacterium]NLV47960.1 glutamine-hydrolyzing GMP synthase [Clostridiaceae bacterium]
MEQVVVIIDLGGTDHSELARLIRKMGVYSEIQPHDLTADAIRAMPQIKGLIFNGGLNRTVSGCKVMPSPDILALDVPKIAFGCSDMTQIDHPEFSEAIIKTFLFDQCHCDQSWTIEAFIEKQTQEIRRQVGSEHVLLALSGGVDSSVVAALLIRAIGDRLTCIHVNHGLLRKGEPEQVIEVFQKQMGATLIYVDAADRFLDKLDGVSDPEIKRKIIGTEFIRVFEEEAGKLEGIRFLAQGTIYPDIVESGTKTAQAIKAHHNVGGLPDDLSFDLIEPIKYLYKDEVRAVGRALGVPENMVSRQPFPGPGLGVRCLGAITRDRLEAVRESDAILREEFERAGLADKVWQYFTVVPEFKSVGVRHHKRSYEYPVIIRAVHTVDAMTATIAHLDWAVLDRITERIVNEVPHVNRVCYDLTPKPTGTIEWE